MKMSSIGHVKVPEEVLERFQKIVDWVKENVAPEDFDMLYFRARKRDDVVLEGSTLKLIVDAPFVNKENCGSVGCLLGWAPFIEGLEPPLDCFKQELPTYRSTVKPPPELNFRYYQQWISDNNYAAGVFMFDPDWGATEVGMGTIEDAEKRVEYLRRYGAPVSLESIWDDKEALSEIKNIVLKR